MPSRHAYVGDPRPPASYPSIPMQPETTAYLARFSGPASQTYKAALNQFVYRCKKAGLWTIWTDLYLFCADTQADALRNVVSAARDATVVGAPTFTALKGFSSLTTSNYFSLPYLNSGFGQFNCANFAAGTLPGSSVGGFTDQIVFGTGKNGGLRLKAGTITNNINATGQKYMNSGAYGSVAMLYGYTWDNTGGGQTECSSGSAGNTGTWNGSMEPSPLALNNVGGSQVVTQISAYGFTTTAMTGPQMRKFLAILGAFLDDLGAIP